MNKSFGFWSLILAFGWIALLGPGVIEGRFFPVVKNVEINAVQDEFSPEWTEISGSFDKIRGECNPRFIEWRKGTRDGNDTAIEYIWGRPEVRLAGQHVFEKWRVHAAPPEAMLNETFADILHRCYIVIPGVNLTFRLPWLTRSKFWN